MTKKEIIWRHILHEILSSQAAQFTQKELGGKFKFSLSTVFNALKAPRKIGAVEVTGRFFRVRDAEKFLYLWATHRNLKRDIIYKTHIDAPPYTLLRSFGHYTQDVQTFVDLWNATQWYAKDFLLVLKQKMQLA